MIMGGTLALWLKCVRFWIEQYGLEPCGSITNKGVCVWRGELLKPKFLAESMKLNLLR